MSYMSKELCNYTILIKKKEKTLITMRFEPTPIQKSTGYCRTLYPLGHEGLMLIDTISLLIYSTNQSLPTDAGSDDFIKLFNLDSKNGRRQA